MSLSDAANTVSPAGSSQGESETPAQHTPPPTPVAETPTTSVEEQAEISPPTSPTPAPATDTGPDDGGKFRLPITINIRLCHWPA